MNFGDGFTLICQLNKNIWYSGVTESSCCGAFYTLGLLRMLTTMGSFHVV